MASKQNLNELLMTPPVTHLYLKLSFNGFPIVFLYGNYIKFPTR